MRRSTEKILTSHSTPLIEHPELVSQRIQRFASSSAERT